MGGGTSTQEDSTGNWPCSQLQLQGVVMDASHGFLPLFLRPWYGAGRERKVRSIRPSLTHSSFLTWEFQVISIQSGQKARPRGGEGTTSEECLSQENDANGLGTK